ncbi:MAG: PQQ-binding-like beta-propeller repeat protein [Bacteroidales bacterium]|jgi:outer membrane protein assembly factor BamB
MKRNAFLTVSIAVVLLLAVTGNAHSQDWQQFRGINRDCKVTGFITPVTWPSELKLVWKVTAGTGDATPVLVGKKIYLNTRQGDNEVILCFDATSGKELWKDTYPANAVTGPAGSHPGPRSTPAIANGKIVTYGASGILSCLDANTGKVLWRKDNPSNAVPQFFTAMSPLIVDGMCIAYVGMKDNGTILCLDIASGAEKWKWTGEGPAYSSPSIMQIDGKKHVILLSEKNIMALDFADGKILWSIPTPLQPRFYNCVSPYIDGRIIYFSGQGTGTKAIKVEKQGDNYVTKELWTNATAGAKWNTPVLHDGFLYGFTDSRKIYCINATDGQTAWIDNATNSDFATLVDCGNVLIGLPSTSNLIIFKPDNKGYTEVARYKVSDTPIYSFPVVAVNAVYIKDAESLMMYKF